MWLENKVELAQYYELLVNQGFEDLDSFIHVTDDNLKEIGIDTVRLSIRLFDAYRHFNQL